MKKSNLSDYSRKFDYLDSSATYLGSWTTIVGKNFLGSNKCPQVPIIHLVHFWKFDPSRPNRHSRQFSSLTNYAPLKVYHRSPTTFPKTQLNDSKISLMVNIEHREPLWRTDRHCLILIRLEQDCKDFWQNLQDL